MEQFGFRFYLESQNCNFKMFRNKLIEFLCDKAWMDANEIEDDTPLFSAGIIDSTDLLEMVSMIEKEFSTKITPGQLTLENFDSVGRILAFAERMKTS